MRRPLPKQLTMVAIFLKWLISGAIFAAELYKFRLFKDSGQVAYAPRWVENIRQDRQRLPLGSCCYTWFRCSLWPCFIPKLCCNFGKGRRLDCISTKIKSVPRSRKGGHNACHHSDIFFFHLLASAKEARGLWCHQTRTEMVSFLLIG